MTNTIAQLKEQLGTELQKPKHKNMVAKPNRYTKKGDSTTQPRDYDKIKSLHTELKTAKAEAKASEGHITITVPATSEQNREYEKKVMVGVNRRRAKRGIVMKQSTYVPKWKKK